MAVAQQAASGETEFITAQNGVLKMRATPAQGAVFLICGKIPPMRLRRDTLSGRIQDGRRMLIQITGKDFGYDLQAWHDYLKESREGGYTWNRSIVLPKIMKAALESDEWRRAVSDLEISPVPNMPTE